MLSTLYSILCLSLLILPLISIASLIKEKINTTSIWLLSTVLTAAASYVILLTAFHSLEKHYETAAYKHDLNGDGIFSKNEQTPEQQEAMQRLTSDTGRNLGTYFLLKTFPIYSVFWHGIIGIPYLMIRKAKQNQASQMKIGKA